MRRKRIRNWENRFREEGYKITSPRKTILSVLEQLEGHPNAREVFNDLSSKSPDIGLTTIYRTLELCVRLGILKKYDFGDGHSRYEIANEKTDHHHHIICEKCSKVIEYRDFLNEETALIKKIQDKLEKKHHFEIKQHVLDFYGLCRECKDKEKSSAED